MIKKTLLLLVTILSLTASAQKPADLNKAVVNVVTYDASGNVLGNAYGFFVGEQGEVVAPYAMFKGAARADVVNWQGQTSHALRIVGASSGNDLVKFTTDVATKKLVSLTPATRSAEKGQTLQVARYTTSKKAQPETAQVTAADPYMSHYYYELSIANEEKFFGRPVLDDEGRVVAVVQKNVQKDAATACAIDIAFATQLSNSVISALASDATAINMAKALPEAEEEAFSYVYMMMQSQQDSTLVVQATEDFLKAFPASGKMYAERATFYANRGNYAAADADLQKVIAMGGASAADALHTQSVLMYGKALNTAPDVYPAWTLDSALASAEQAYALQPLPLYLMQQGHVLYDMQRYDEAYQKFAEVNASNLANAQTFYNAAISLERAGGEPAAVIALLDSVVSRLAVPYNASSASYILIRAQHLHQAGQCRRAVADYNEYEKTIGPRNLTAEFYYQRMQAEVESHMYQQALDDVRIAINKAVSADARAEYLYLQACIQLQVGLFDECIATCGEVLSINAEHGETYKIRGLAFAKKNQKKEALENLNRAAELGAENATALVEKYQ